MDVNPNYIFEALKSTPSLVLELAVCSASNADGTTFKSAGWLSLWECQTVDDDDKPVLPLVEETVTIGKSKFVTGRVRVQTITETINETVPVDLESVDVDVVRVPVFPWSAWSTSSRTSGWKAM